MNMVAVSPFLGLICKLLYMRGTAEFPYRKWKKNSIVSDVGVRPSKKTLIESSARHHESKV